MKQTGILSRLVREGPATASALATQEKISPQAVATAVRELEDPGLVSRTVDDHDRRRMQITITAAGRERLASELGAGQDWLARTMAERLSAAEQAQVAAVVPLLLRLTEGRA